MSSKIPLTAKGFERLTEELKNLKEVERPAIIRSIAEARDHGDLSENAEYHAAREKQSFIEGRISDLEASLSRAEIIDPVSLSGERVIFGATVRISNLESDEESTYQIVGGLEADIDLGLISNQSPIARAMIGKSVGDIFEFESPSGGHDFEICEVMFR